MNVTRRMIVIPVAAVMAAGIGAGAFAVGLTAARDVPEAVTQDTTFFVTMDGQQEFSAGGVAGAGDLDGIGRRTGHDRHGDRPGVRRRRVHRRRPHQFDAHPPRCGRSQRTGRRRLRSHPGSGTVRHLRDVHQRVDRRDRGEPARLLPERPHDTVPGRRGQGSAPATGQSSPRSCRHRFGCTTPGCRTRSAPRRSSRTRPPSST